MKKTLILVAALGVAGVANAQLFTSNAAFQAAIGNDPGQFLMDLNGTSENLSGGTPLMTVDFTAPTGIYNSGSFYGANVPADAVTLTLGGGVRAVGGQWFQTNISDVFQGNPVTLTFSDGFTTTWTPANAAEFRGYVSGTVLTSVVVSAGGVIGGVGNYASMDNVVVSSVPEPATMTALALGAAAMLRRRNKKA